MAVIIGMFAGLLIGNGVVGGLIGAVFGVIVAGKTWAALKPKKGYTEDWKQEDVALKPASTRDDMTTTTVNDETEDVALKPASTRDDMTTTTVNDETEDVALKPASTRDKGIRYTCLRLSQRNWKIAVRTIGRLKLYDIGRDGTQYTLQIRTLAKEAPVPFPVGLDVLDNIDYLIICNNLQGHPNLIVMEPKIVKDSIYKDKLNDGAYWLQPRTYNKYGTVFDQVFA